MTENKTQDIVTIDIEDLEEIVGGLQLSAASLKIGSLQEAVQVSSPGSVFYDPDTCPTSPGGPVSTCMCPGSGGLAGQISMPGSIVTR